MPLLSVSSVLTASLISAVALAANSRLLSGFKQHLRASDSPIVRLHNAKRVDLLIASTLPLTLMGVTALLAAAEGAPQLVATIGVILACVSAVTLAQLVALKLDVSKER